MAEFIAVLRRRKVYKVRRDSFGCDYKSLYRFKKENVEWIAEHFLGESNETRGGALSNIQKMRIFLRYLGDPGFQTGVAEDIGVDQSTVSRTFTQVLSAVLQKSNCWIKFPATANAFQDAMTEWQEKCTFPAAIGAIDCTHILIKRPHEHQDEYVNTLSMYRLLVMLWRSSPV